MGARIDMEALRERLHALLSVFRNPTCGSSPVPCSWSYFSAPASARRFISRSPTPGLLPGLHRRVVRHRGRRLDLGGLIYRWRLNRLSRRTLLQLSVLGGVLSTLSYLLLSSAATAVVIWFLGGITSMVAMIATMSLAAESSPEGAEGFAFAAMMSIVNLTGPLSDTMGSALYEHVFNQKLAPLIIVSAAATAIVFFLIPLMLFRKGSPTGAPADAPPATAWQRRLLTLDFADQDTPTYEHASVV